MTEPTARDRELLREADEVAESRTLRLGHALHQPLMATVYFREEALAAIAAAREEGRREATALMRELVAAGDMIEGSTDRAHWERFNRALKAAEDFSAISESAASEQRESADKNAQIEGDEPT